MNDYTYRVMFIYDERVTGDTLSCIGALVFKGDGKYISSRNKIRIAVSDWFSQEFSAQEDRYLVLYDVLSKLKTFVTEQELLNHIIEKTDFRVSFSVPYEYPFDKLSGQVFRNVLKKNDMFDFEELRCDEDVRI